MSYYNINIAGTIKTPYLKIALHISHKIENLRNSKVVTLYLRKMAMSSLPL